MIVQEVEVKVNFREFFFPTVSLFKEIDLIKTLRQNINYKTQ
jgi:hypothetical protein